MEFYNYNSGEIEGISFYDKGLLHGSSVKYYLDSETILQKSIYKQGVKVSSEEFTSLGIKTNSFEYLEGNIVIYKQYYSNGQLNILERSVNNLREGISKVYHENGNLSISCFFKNDKCDGCFTQYFENGEVKKQETYKNGVFIK